MLFGAEQLVYSVFSLFFFYWKQPPAVAENDAVRALRVNQNNKVKVEIYLL